MGHKKELPIAGRVEASVSTLHVSHRNAEPRMLLPNDSWGPSTEDVSMFEPTNLVDRVSLTEFMPEGFDGTGGQFRFSISLPKTPLRYYQVVPMQRLTSADGVMKWLSKIDAVLSEDESARLILTLTDARARALQAATDREQYQRAEWLRERPLSRVEGGRYVF